MLPSEGAEVAQERVPSRHRVEQANVHARTKLPFRPKPVRMRVRKGVELDPPPVPVVHAAKGYSLLVLDVQSGSEFTLVRGGFGRNNQVRLC